MWLVNCWGGGKRSSDKAVMQIFLLFFVLRLIEAEPTADLVQGLL